MQAQEVVVYPSGFPRWLEWILTSVGLVLLAPLLGLGAIAVKLSSPGPVLFKQQRIGRGGKPFVLYKFRTMYVHASGPGVTAGKDRRITRVGRLLRKTKLDELPELWNIVRGDMALVGPRPEVPAFVTLDDVRWRQVLAVRPGITDPVTLWLRNEEELMNQVEDVEQFYREVLLPIKLKKNIEYLTQRSPWRDFMIILRTIEAIIRPAKYPSPTLEEIYALSNQIAHGSEARV